MSFVHLHVHSEYSLLESSCTLKGLVAEAAKDQQQALALTDNGNMFGAIEFYFQCKAKGVKPILGLDAYLAPRSRFELKHDRNQVRVQPTRLVFLAMSHLGYQQLCRISSIGYQEGFYYKPRIDDEVLQMNLSDLIVLSGGRGGDIVQRYLLEGADAARERARFLKNIFGDRFYLEVTRTGDPDMRPEVQSFLLELGRAEGIPVVATNDVHFLKQEDQVVQDVLVCIGGNRLLTDESRPRLASDQFFLKSSAQMRELFSDLPELCDNTLAIAERLNVEFKLKDAQGKPIYHLPSFPTAEGRSLEEEIKAQALQGLEARFQEAEERGEPVAPEKKQAYFARLDFELGVIHRMGFNGYFLIVADFINWAKTKGIPVGPGRGSGAGSLVAYSLRITDLDPMPYSLLFERFLNPERISMPDFDIDFCQDRRGEVIQYVTQKYGPQSVSQIITYGKLQAKAAIKDVGRVLGMGFGDVDQVSKLVPEKPGTTLAHALEAEPRIRELMETDPQINNLLGLAQRVEGLVRHAGIHAAGVIIADGQLIEKAPLYRGAEGENVVQYDMKHAEKIGLIKFDFLGLKTLTMIDHALKLIGKNRGVKLQAHEISLNDPGIYEVMTKGDTAGIFQFEGEGITDAIRKIRPNNFYDITAINALYRPGPMAMIPEYTKRKHGEVPVQYLFEEMKEILEETYGVIVYQEQVMGIASVIAGYTLGQADMLRRAMGKKIKEEMDQQRELFLKGAVAKGFDRSKASELFDLIYKFAEYGFNKSHAAAYCVLAAQTAFLKCYYPAEFYAALLSTELSDTDKIVKYVKDAQKHELTVAPPHINESEFLFTVRGDVVYFGLGAIKGVGQSAIDAILEARAKLEEKRFSSLEQFFELVELRKINKKVIESLIKAGAFDGFGYHRAQLLSQYPVFLDRAGASGEARQLGQGSLFDFAPETDTRVELREVPEMSRSELSAMEKEVLGFYLSDHPLKGIAELAGVWTTAPIKELPQVLADHQAKLVLEGAPQKYDFRNRDANKKRVVICGMVGSKKEMITKKGTRMAFATLEDMNATVELVIFPDTYNQCQGELAQTEIPFLVGGFLEGENGACKIIVDSIVPLERALQKIKKLRVRLDRIDEEQLLKVKDIFAAHRGSVQVEWVLRLSEFSREVQFKNELAGVSFDRSLLEHLQGQVGQLSFLEMGAGI